MAITNDNKLSRLYAALQNPPDELPEDLRKPFEALLVVWKKRSLLERVTAVNTALAGWVSPEIAESLAKQTAAIANMVRVKTPADVALANPTLKVAKEIL